MKPLIGLAAIGALCALLLAGTHTVTEGAIRANRQAHAWRVAFELTGSAFPTAGLRWDSDRLHLPNGYSLRRLEVDGYAGAIELLAAFKPRGHGAEALVGVRVTKHQETPGLGDFVDTARSPWIRQFSNRPPEQVDTVTGATITSQAVKRGVMALLQPALAAAVPAAGTLPTGRAGERQHRILEAEVVAGEGDLPAGRTGVRGGEVSAQMADSPRALRRSRSGQWGAP